MWIHKFNEPSVVSQFWVHVLISLENFSFKIPDWDASEITSDSESLVDLDFVTFRVRSGALGGSRGSVSEIVGGSWTRGVSSIGLESSWNKYLSAWPSPWLSS